ncbi:trypsin-like peptidase domain-containing protein [Bosea sp. (in: a-proteobacteria)]|uniref:trypsin-like peptidase domain-containing protein n=1 Tax=Bosea sp. (in: a-proteobacteria) TaxID=1871050 RepID=UPI001AD4A87C|nr:trypsin-like peptidase domain-containing protein [Bosea sp. (in: a-proteobacteria)]MBN9444561.1 trypsin-like peptidase domain-containing protein [Bosea sp. (in: a-proteobacteria)]
MVPTRRPQTGLAGAAVLGLMLLAALPGSARAQAPNPLMAAAQARFEALPEAERKAIQADLIWAGQFNGAVSGSFGPLTFKAINALKGGRGPADGILAPADRAALARAAQAARDASGFRLVEDERTGVRIGIPSKLLPRRDVSSSGSRWQSADEKVTLDTSASPPGEDLAALFEKATAVNPRSPRKITYKLLRPDFFVVTGETPTGRFYRRLAAGPQGVRGFSVGYDKALAPSVDKLVIAIAASFEPFPTGPAPSAAAPPASAGSAPAARVDERYGVAVMLSDKVALTAAVAVEGCRSLRAGNRTARPRTRDESGLVLIDLDGTRTATPPALAGEAIGAGEALVLVAYADDAGKRATVALPGQLTRAGSGAMVTAPLQPGQAGSPAFDRQGRLVGLVTANPSDKQLVAGVAPQRAHAMAGPAVIREILSRSGLALPAGASSPEMSTGAVVEKVSAAVLPLVCAI